MTSLKKVYFVFVLATSLLLFAWGTRYLSQQALSTPIVFDEAYNLQIPFHVARDGVYGTHAARPPGSAEYGHYVLNPYITTGPSVLLPIAWAYSLFDGSLVAVARKTTFAFFALFTLLLPLFAYSRSGRFWIFIPATGASIWILNHPGWSSLCTQILGEGPGVTYFVLAVLIADLAHRRKKSAWMMLAGMIGGFSVLAKLLFLVPWAGAFVWLLWHQLRNRSDAWRGRDVLLFSGGFFAALLAWEINQIAIMGGWNAYVAFKREYVGHFLSISGGPLPRSKIGSTEWRDFAVQKAMAVNETLLQSTRVYLLIILGCSFGAMKIFFPVRFARWIGERANFDPWLALIFAAVAYHAWFILSSGLGWTRHYQPAAVLLAVGAAGILLEILAVRFPRRENYPFALTFIFVCLVVFLVRASQPISKGLLAQFQAQTAVARLEAEIHPVWLSQVNTGFDPGMALLSQTNVYPFLLNRGADQPSICSLPLPKGENYAIITEIIPTLTTPTWRCRQEKRLFDFPTPAVAFDLVYCSAHQIFCE